MDVGLGRLRELVMDREACHAVIHEVANSRKRLSDWTELNHKLIKKKKQLAVYIKIQIYKLLQACRLILLK